MIDGGDSREPVIAANYSYLQPHSVPPPDRPECSKKGLFWSGRAAAVEEFYT